LGLLPGQASRAAAVETPYSSPTFD